MKLLHQINHRLRSNLKDNLADQFQMLIYPFVFSKFERRFLTINLWDIFIFKDGYADLIGMSKEGLCVSEKKIVGCAFQVFFSTTTPSYTSTLASSILCSYTFTSKIHDSWQRGACIELLARFSLKAAPKWIRLLRSWQVECESDGLDLACPPPIKQKRFNFHMKMDRLTYTYY